jgi:hypothetical protein
MSLRTGRVVSRKALPLPSETGTGGGNRTHAFGVKARCSTFEQHPHGRDGRTRSYDLPVQSRTLFQLSYVPMVGERGFEPPSLGLRGRYTSHCATHPTFQRAWRESNPRILVNSQALNLSATDPKAPGPGEPRSKDARLSEIARPSPGGSLWNLLRSVGARGLEPPQTGLKARCPSSRALLPCPETSKAASVSRGGSRVHGVWCESLPGATLLKGDGVGKGHVGIRPIGG